MRSFLLSILFVVFVSLANGQVKTNFNNREQVTVRGKFSKNFRGKSPFTIPARDIKELLDKDALENASGEPKPFKVAEAIEVDIDVVREADWVEDNGFAYGKFSVIAADAKSVSANFDQFYLPEGTELYVYNENAEMITGPITETENNENNFWGTWVYKGGRLTVDLKTPVESKSLLRLHISSIAYGYKDLYVANFGESAACNVNVICPAGNGWENERNSVALILDANSEALCSGALINNTCNLNIPYLLTANHCFDTPTQQNVAQWKFTFQAWSVTCTPSQNADGVTFNGSTLRARNAASDFCLVELSQLPPANSSITFSGWNRNTNAAANSVGIHHPAGDVMKISIDANAPSAVAWLSGATNHWRAHFQQGTVQPGSSGSPLFDENHRVIGQLHGDQNNQGDYCSQQIGEYGKFDVSWTGGGTNATRLSNWLDPNNTGALTTNIRGIGILGPAIVCSAESYSVVGPAVTWSSSEPSGLSINSSTGSASRENDFNGQVTITATVSGGCNVNLSRTIWVGTPSVSLESGAYTYEVCAGEVFAMGYTPTSEGQGISGQYWSCSNCSLTTDPYGSTVNVQAPGSGYFNVSVDVTNACGTNPNVKYFVAVDEIDGQPCQLYLTGGGELELNISPNPTSDLLTIEVANPDSKSPSQTLTIELINEKQEVVATECTNLNILNIETKHLKNGVYYLKGERGDYSVTKRILISH